jgi:purine-binding chemotaxis protein CheW
MSIASSLLATDSALQFLTFTLGEEEYGVDIMTVREVKGWTETTRLPNSPEYVRGVLNLRGIIIPIFDLRARFTGKMTEANSTHVVIILAVEDRIIGVLADTVSDILTVNSSEIKPTPETNNEIDQRFVAGLIAVEERMVVLLDMAHLLTHDDLEHTAIQQGELHHG